MRNKQLTLDERYHIEALNKQGYKQIEIAKEIRVHPSTISRELKRNKFHGKYQALQAQAEYMVRQKKKKKRKSISKSIEKIPKRQISTRLVTRTNIRTNETRHQ